MKWDVYQSRKRYRNVSRTDETSTHSSYEHLEFKATTGWCAKFKMRTVIKHLVMSGEFASADKE